jgi:hemin uptake protein HemP
MTEKRQQPDRKPEAEVGPDLPRIIAAEDLFKGSREVFLELAGVRYRLRITRRNKLILQK